MKELVLREELPPDDVVVVVRGGEMNSDFVRRTATRSYEEVGVFTVRCSLRSMTRWRSCAGPSRT